MEKWEIGNSLYCIIAMERVNQPEFFGYFYLNRVWLWKKPQDIVFASCFCYDMHKIYKFRLIAKECLTNVDMHGILLIIINNP